MVLPTPPQHLVLGIEPWLSMWSPGRLPSKPRDGSPGELQVMLFWQECPGGDTMFLATLTLLSSNPGEVLCGEEPVPSAGLPAAPASLPVPET